jgi:acyl-coenzyme A thioesterase PaaI-like protein
MESSQRRGHGMEKPKKFETYGNCFVCGENNPGGLRLNFEINREKQTLETTFVAGPVFQGYDGIVHGGILSTLLDEAMAKLGYELGYDTITAALEIKFKKPAPILKPLKVYGEITEVKGRIVKAKARVATEDGTILATGSGILMRQR